MSESRIDPEVFNISPQCPRARTMIFEFFGLPMEKHLVKTTLKNKYAFLVSKNGVIFVYLQ